MILRFRLKVCGFIFLKLKKRKEIVIILCLVGIRVPLQIQEAATSVPQIWLLLFPNKIDLIFLHATTY